MKTKFLFTFLLAAIVVLVMPNFALADSADSGFNPAVYIDTTNGGSATLTPGNLEDRVMAAIGSTQYYIKELHIDASVSGSLNADDIAFLNKIMHLHVLYVADTITVGDVGDDFMSDGYAATTSYLTDVTFPATAFGNNAFMSHENLINLSLPNAQTFGDNAFFSCNDLASVNLPSALSFGNDAFNSCCYALTDISLPLATTFGNYAFAYCQVLENVDLPLATTFGNSAFWHCDVLERIYLPNAQTFGMKIFNSCEKLLNAGLPSAQSLDLYAFQGCTSLDTISFGSTVPTVGSWFYGTASPYTLKIYVPAASLAAYDAADAPTDDGLWEGLTLYTHNTGIIYNANNADGGSVPVDPTVYSQGDDAVISNNTGSLIKGGHRFTGWNTKANLSGTHYNAGDTLLFVCGTRLYAEFEFDDSGIVNITSDTGATLSAGGLQARVEAIMGASDVALSVIELHIDSSVSGVLNEVDIAYINTMINLEILDVADTMSVENGNYSGTSNVGNHFLKDFIYLKQVTFPAKYYGIFNMLGCSELTDVSLPYAETFEMGAFQDCVKLVNVSLPNAHTFGAQAFMECDSINDISLPSVVTFGNTAFYSCNNLVALTLPLAETFGSYAFWHCGNLTSLTLPSARNFDEHAFENCFDLDTLTLGGHVPAIVSWGTALTGSLYVPASAMSAYDADSAPSDDGLWNGFTIYANSATTYTVTYDVSNATGTAPVDASSPYGYGAVVTVLGKTASFDKDGYYLTGWNTESDGSGTHYNEGDTFTILEDTTLYSQWELITYTVTYDLNGIAGEPPVDDNLYLPGDNFTTDDGEYYKEGFDFNNWNTQSDGKGINYTKGATYSINSDLYLYIEWKCTVTYDGNGADSGDVYPPQKYNENEDAPVHDENTLAKEGHAFAGWNTEPDGSGTTYNVGDYITMTGHETLYAVWNAVPNRISTVDAKDVKITQINTACVIDLSTIFEDAEGDDLTYEVSINGDNYESCESTYSFTPVEIGNTTLVFRCSDDLSDSVDTYEVDLCAIDSDFIEDGVIDLLDMAVLAEHYNTVSEVYDQTNDDFINLFDMVMMAWFIE